MKKADLHEDYSGDISDSDDILSFANLPIPGYIYDPSGRISSSSEQDRFEFLNSFGPDPVKNDPFSPWGKTKSKSINNEARTSFKSRSNRKSFKAGSARKSRSSSVRVTATNHLHSGRFWPVLKENVKGVDAGSSVKKGHNRHELPQVEESEVAIRVEHEKPPTWCGSHFANVLAKFGCLSA